MRQRVHLKCESCGKCSPLERCGLEVLSEEAVYTCPVCGTRAKLRAELIEPVVRSGGDAGVGPALPPGPPMAPPEPPMPPGDDMGAPPMGASFTDDDLSSLLVEIRDGLSPHEALSRVVGDLDKVYAIPASDPLPIPEDFADDDTFNDKAERLVFAGLKRKAVVEEEETGAEELEEQEKKKGDRPSSWEGSLADFNTKLQALMDDDEIGVQVDLGRAVAAMQEGGALTAEGDQIQLDLGKLVTALAKFLDEQEGPEGPSMEEPFGPPLDREMDLGSELGMDEGPPDEPLPPSMEMEAVDDLDGSVVKPIEPMPRKPVQDKPTNGWEDKIKKCLPKYF